VKDFWVGYETLPQNDIMNQELYTNLVSTTDSFCSPYEVFNLDMKKKNILAYSFRSNKREIHV